MNNFVILTPAYKVSKWLDMYVSMLKHQTYKNFTVVFIDDASPDDTYEKFIKLTKGDERFTIHRNETNIGSPLANIVKAFDIASPQEDDIVVNIDGDDWLSSVFVLDYLNQIYEHHNCWMTYGSYQIYPTGDIGGHANLSFTQEVINTNAYKRYPFISSHLRTYKTWLFNKVQREDLIDPRTDKLYQQAGDLALMFPMLEMSGNKALKISDILLILNRENELNEATLSVGKQKQAEEVIRTNQKTYERLNPTEGSY